MMNTQKHHVLGSLSAKEPSITLPTEKKTDVDVPPPADGTKTTPTARTVHAFNSLVTCSASGCARVARSKCSACQVCYYCSLECRDRDAKEKHRALCAVLHAYFTGTVHHIFAYAKGVPMAVPGAERLLALARTSSALVALFRRRQMWFEVTWPMSMAADASPQDVKQLVAQVLTSKGQVVRSARHVSALCRADIPWPAEAEVACETCVNRSAQRPWFEDAFKSDFVFPEVCLVFRIAGIVPAPERLRRLYVDPKSGLTSAQIGCLRQQTSISFGRSIGFLVV